MSYLFVIGYLVSIFYVFKTNICQCTWDISAQVKISLDLIIFWDYHSYTMDILSCQPEIIPRLTGPPPPSSWSKLEHCASLWSG